MSEDFAAAFELEEAKIKERFLEEVAKIIARQPLINGKPVKSYTNYAAVLGVHASFIGEVKSDRYKVNMRVLWVTKKYFPAFDIDYVLFGIRSTIAPAPARARRSPQVSGSAETATS